MLAKHTVDGLCDSVNGEVEHLLGTTAFRQWADALSFRADDWIVFNNSFLFREGITGTSKNSKYLCVPVEESGTPSLLASVATSSERINARCKVIPARRGGEHAIQSLQVVVAEEVKQLGTI